MYNNKKIKLIWTVIAIVGVVAMIFFTIMPAFYGSGVHGF